MPTSSSYLLQSTRAGVLYAHSPHSRPYCRVVALYRRKMVVGARGTYYWLKSCHTRAHQKLWRTCRIRQNHAVFACCADAVRARSCLFYVPVGKTKSPDYICFVGYRSKPMGKPDNWWPEAKGEKKKSQKHWWKNGSGSVR